MSKIMWIGGPLTNRVVKDKLLEIKHPETKVEVVSRKKGPEHLMYRYYEALVIPEILYIIKKAERDGYDGAIIGCFYDPGLYDAKEIVDTMVVTAPAEACTHLAATMGYKFSVIVNENLCIPQMMDNIVLYGLKDKVASFKSLEIGILDLHKNEEFTIQRIKDKAKEAVEKDRAEVIILGCTVQSGFYKEIQDYIGVPVIDPVIATFKYAEYLVELKNKFGWLHSKKYGFKSPPNNEL